MDRGTGGSTGASRRKVKCASEEVSRRIGARDRGNVIKYSSPRGREKHCASRHYRIEPAVVSL